MKNIIFTLFVSLLLLIKVNAQENIIKNGQFVNGTEDWQVLLNDKNEPIKAHIEQSVQYKDYGLADNFIGTNFVELDEKSAIQQYIPTKKGESYAVSFAIAHRPFAGMKQFIVTVDGKVVYTKTVRSSTEAGSFNYKTARFKARKDNSKIIFQVVTLDGDTNKGVLITDIYCHKINNEDLEKYNNIKF